MHEFGTELTALRVSLHKAFWAVLVAAALLYVASGFYIVRPNQVAITVLFGAVHGGPVGAGPHYRLPWPFMRVYRVDREDVRRLQAGFGTDPQQTSALEAAHGPRAEVEDGTLLEPYCITGDRNIVHLTLIVQYRVRDPEGYLFTAVRPERILVLLVQEAIVESVAPEQVDEILTAGKPALQRRIRGVVQERLDALTLGIGVEAVEITNVRPPTEAAEAFRDVITAQEERNTAIHEAESYRNRTLPEAQAEAARMLTEAHAYAAETVARAEGEASRFLDLAEAYQKAPETTAIRLRLEAVEEIAGRVRTRVIDPGSEQAPRRILFNLTD